VEKVRALVPGAKGAAGQTLDSVAPSAVSGGDTAAFSWVDKPAQEEKEDDGLAPPLAPDEIGRLGPYRVLKVLGEGGMGKVFLAEDPNLQRAVALKVMKASLAKNTTARQRFLREARLAAKIEHDHIVHIYQVGEDRGIPFLAMQLLKGASLEDLLNRSLALKTKQVLRIGIQIAEGLAAAHEHGMIHRDIKPGNIWIESTGGGRVKILDFGLARTSQGEVGITQSGTILGTPAYMPPEQARGEKLDYRCDLYSLGCVLYRMATGEMPLKGHDTMSMLMSLALQEPTAPIKVNPEIPPALSDLIMKLLAKDPQQRPASAKEVVQALKAMERAGNSPTPTETALLSPSLLQPASELPMAIPLPDSKSPDPYATAPAPKKSTPPSVPSPSGRAEPRKGPVAAGEGAGRKRRKKPLVLAAVAFLALLGGGMLAGIVFFWQTPNGVVRFEIDDPEIKVVVDKNGPTITGADKQPISLKPGPHGLTITRGDFTFDTTKFQLNKNGKTTLKIDWLPGKLQIVQDGKVIGAKEVQIAKGEPDKGGPDKGGPDKAAPSAWQPVPFGKSPLDALDPAAIPPEERFDWQPKELVAVLGSHRQRLWGGAGGVAIRGDGKRVTAGGAGLPIWEFETAKEIDSAPGSNFPALSMDGRKLFNGWDRIYDLDRWLEFKKTDPSAKLVDTAATVPFTRYADGRVANAQFSADGKSFVATLNYSLKRVALWRVDKEVKIIGEWPGFGSPALSLDGKMLAMVHAKELTVHLFDIQGDKVQPRGVLSAEDAKAPEPYANRSYLRFAHDGRLGVLAADSKSIAFWDVAGPKPQKLGVLPVDLSYNGSFRFAAKAPRMVTVTQYLFHIWRLTEKGAEREAGVSMQDTGLAVMNISDVPISADGNRLVSGHLNGAVLFWEVKDGKLVQRNPLTPQPATSYFGANFHFSPTGKFLTTGGEAGTTVWHFGDKSPKGFLPKQLAVSAFSGRDEVTGSIDEEELITWRVTPTAVKEISRRGARGNASVALETGLVLTRYTDDKAATRYGRILDMRVPNAKASDAFEIGGIGSGFGSADFLSADGRVFASWIASPGKPDTIRVFDIQNGKATMRYDFASPKNTPTQRLRLSRDGQWLAATWGNGSDWGIWRLDPSEAKSHRAGRGLAGGYSPDGKQIALITIDGIRKLEIRDVESWDLLWSTQMPGGMNDAVFAPDGRHLLVANANQTAYILRLP
jgi:serine/threonine protein kinase/WD40 repeat protein